MTAIKSTDYFQFIYFLCGLREFNVYPIAAYIPCSAHSTQLFSIYHHQLVASNIQGFRAILPSLLPFLTEVLPQVLHSFVERQIVSCNSTQRFSRPFKPTTAYLKNSILYALQRWEAETCGTNFVVVLYILARAFPSAQISSILSCRRSVFKIFLTLFWRTMKFYYFPISSTA